MRYRELLREGDTSEEISSAAAIIKQECQPFLSEVHNPLSLYRGMDRGRNNGDILRYKTSHLDGRRPMAMGVDLQEIVNEYFTETFGHPFRNGVLAIGNKSHTGTFGTSHWIFPKGKFEFLWSKKIDDLNFHRSMILPLNRVIIPGDERIKNRVYSGLESLNYQTTDLDEAIVSFNEIMLWCEGYYAIEWNPKYEQPLKDFLK